MATNQKKLKSNKKGQSQASAVVTAGEAIFRKYHKAFKVLASY